jgi:uncharacterized membrane protein
VFKAMAGGDVEDVLSAIVTYLIVFAETCGAFVLTVGVARALIGYIRSCVLQQNTKHVPKLRISLGQSMVLALEFQVAADILKTGLSPTWEDILLLAATIALRTILNYLLERELAMLDSSTFLFGKPKNPPSNRFVE